jgi:uncharacterized protein YfbU (UPF0304 family)
MKLTYLERLTLSNQYKILEALYPEDAEHYSLKREAIERGYELEYRLLDDAVDYDELDEAGCKEVRDILEMFRHVGDAMKKTSDVSLREDYHLTFRGFDGNNETKQFSYVVHLYKKGHFKELTQDGYKNSHGPIFHKYKRMLEVWETLDNKHSLKDDDLRDLARAAISS